MVKSVAVIGAGVSGLGAVKSCLEEGLQPTCFEKSDGIGGLWDYKEDVEDGNSSIYWSLHTNTSKELMCYSDFTMPDNFPNYLHNSKVLEYLKLYAEHFKLMKHIKFQTKVCSVRKQPNFSTSGQWEVVTESDGKQTSAIFDAVMLCTGRYVDPCYPLESFCGLENFKGKHFHSREYKRPDGFQGKRVLVVGLGNSGVDIATDISHFSKQVFLSTQRGGWILGRLSHKGYPWDAWFVTRFNTWIRQLLPKRIVDWLIVRHLNQRFDQSNYGLQRDSSLWKVPVVNDDLPVCIIRGSVVMKPGVREFNEHSVTFEDGTMENIDVVIFATGYNWSFPYLHDPDIKLSTKEVSLYRNVFPPHLEKPTLAFIGLIEPVGSVLVTVEMQARWATRVFKGINILPSSEKQKEDILKNAENTNKRLGANHENVLSVEYTDYLDEVASEIGVIPNIFQLLLTDPRLALEIIFGPFTSPQYRLTGPGKWVGARDAILTKGERILKPTRTRVVKHEDKRSAQRILLAFCFFVLFASVFMF